MFKTLKNPIWYDRMTLLQTAMNDLGNRLNDSIMNHLPRRLELVGV
jgi:hypothetical protein